MKLILRQLENARLKLINRCTAISLRLYQQDPGWWRSRFRSVKLRVQQRKNCCEVVLPQRFGRRFM